MSELLVLVDGYQALEEMVKTVGGNFDYLTHGFNRGLWESMWRQYSVSWWDERGPKKLSELLVSVDGYQAIEEMVKTIGGNFDYLPTVKTVGYGNPCKSNIQFRCGMNGGPKKLSEILVSVDGYQALQEMVKTIGGNLNHLPTVKTVGYGNTCGGNIRFGGGMNGGLKKCLNF